MLTSRFFVVLIILLASQGLRAQVILEANAPGNTYEDINAVFAPGYDVVEVPDCAHPEFGRHISEVFDTELNKNVFRFMAHVMPDNDRCKKQDRQRIEIKTYGNSPEQLKATEGETVTYRWKFKLAEGFQTSSSFTHVHQIKSVGGPFESMPMFTLTLRNANPDHLELRYTATNDQNTLAKADLALFKGTWVDVTETITFGDSGSYAIKITSIESGKLLLDYHQDHLDTWQNGAEFARPKWGIYRSLKHPEALRDETVLFADFSIAERVSATTED